MPNGEAHSGARPAVALRGITRRFPGVLANDRVDLTLERGEIRALVGENGAGKTTLMRVLYGLERPDAGEIRLHGRRVTLRSPSDAIRAHIGMVHQHFMLFPSLDVAENVTYGAEPRRLGLFDRRRAEREVDELAKRHGLAVDPRARVGALPVGLRQRVEILKALYRGAEILILDEPTAVLTPGERDGLFAVLRNLAAAGSTILFVTHKLSEVLRLADRATVLRRGAVSGTVETERATAEELSRMMVGRAVGGSAERPPPPVTERIRLRVEDLRARRSRQVEAVRGVSLEVRAGEILGVAAAAGNGQEELVETIVGLRAAAGGRVLLDQQELGRTGVGERRRAGLGYIPEDRDGVGLALEASIADNLALGSHADPPLCRRGLLSAAALRRHAAALLASQGVAAVSPGQPAVQLSGGNRQRLVVARELARDLRLLVVEQPTRGVDVAGSEAIHRQLLAFRERGGAVLMVSADLSELERLCDRILVLYEGRVAGELEAGEASEARLGLLMGGAA